MNTNVDPAVPRGNAAGRALSNVHADENTAVRPELEVNFAADYIARRYRLAAPLARLVVELARLGEAFA